ncbi:hypothetical protein D3C78_1748900 [compost metagenome]
MKELFIALVCLLIGYRLGWQVAHVTVATECERLGAFFVGKTTYKCTAIEKDSEA